MDLKTVLLLAGFSCTAVSGVNGIGNIPQFAADEDKVTSEIPQFAADEDKVTSEIPQFAADEDKVTSEIP